MTTASITSEVYYPYTPERVWRALTTSAVIARWLMPNTFEPRIGHHFTFQTNPMPAFGFDGVCHCEVTAYEEPRLLSYTFDGGALRTQVTYQLAPEGAGTRLRFEHSGFDLDDPVQRGSYQGMQGWGQALEVGLLREIEALPVA
ncbi:MAG TPA: SRPBCC domain-containing protein [Ktedonobacterales bacterium]